MAVGDKNRVPTTHQAQYILNFAYDSDTQSIRVLSLGYDGSEAVLQEASDQQIYVVESGDYSYICKAAVGTPLASPNWKIFRVDGNGSKLYADANADYDNVASNPASLSYSFS